MNWSGRYGGYRRGIRSPWIRDHKMGRRGHDGLRALDVVTRFGHPGYTWYAVMDDGGLMCRKCLLANYREVYRETRDDWRTGWTVAGATNCGELEGAEYCANCNARLDALDDEMAESRRLHDLTGASIEEI